MNKLVLAVIIVLLSGCGSVVTSVQIDAAIELCRNNEGLSKIISGGDNDAYKDVVCNNGARFWLKPRVVQ